MIRVQHFREGEIQQHPYGWLEFVAFAIATYSENSEFMPALLAEGPLILGNLKRTDKVSLIMRGVVPCSVTIQHHWIFRSATGEEIRLQPGDVVEVTVTSNYLEERQ